MDRPSTAPCTSEASSVVHGAVRGSARARLSPPRSKPCSPARVSRYRGSRRTWGPAGPFLSVLTRSPPSSLLIQDAWSTPPSSPRPPDRQVAEEKVATEPNAVVSAASSRGRGSRGASHEASASEEHCPGPPPAEARWDSELVGASSLRLPRSVRSVQQPGAVVMALMSPEGLLAIPSGKSPDCTASVTLLGFEVDPSNASCTAVLSSASDRLRPLLGAKVGSRSVAGGTPSSFIQFVEQLSGDEMGFNGVSLILAVSPFLSSLERIRPPENPPPPPSTPRPPTIPCQPGRPAPVTAPRDPHPPAPRSAFEVGDVSENETLKNDRTRSLSLAPRGWWPAP